LEKKARRNEGGGVGDDVGVGEGWVGVALGVKVCVTVGLGGTGVGVAGWGVGEATDTGAVSTTLTGIMLAPASGVPAEAGEVDVRGKATAAPGERSCCQIIKMAMTTANRNVPNRV
jgi:hypothetical protein